MSFQKALIKTPLVSAWFNTVADVLPALENIPFGLTTVAGETGSCGVADCCLLHEVQKIKAR